MRIVVMGGTGFVGRRVVGILGARNHGVVVASRDPDAARARLPPGVATCGMDGDSLLSALAGAGAVVNLAGEPVITGWWTAERKRGIRESRVDGTRRLVAAMASLAAHERPRVLVSGSAIGWYGDTGEDARDESASQGSDFLARTCIDWEAAAREAEAHGIRVVLVRTGIVLDRGGGALAQMEPAFRGFVGAPLGPGANWMSWIHRDDLALLIAFACESERLKGPVNAVAPEPARQITLCRGIARRLRRPCWPGVPRPLVRLLFGERAGILLGSQRIMPKAALDAGFAYRFGTLEGALDDLYPGRPRPVARPQSA